jgi:hypothetical protein
MMMTEVQNLLVASEPQEGPATRLLAFYSKGVFAEAENLTLEMIEDTATWLKRKARKLPTVFGIGG